MLESPSTADGGKGQNMHARRRSTQLPPSPHDSLHRRLPSFFSGLVPRSGPNSENVSPDRGSSEDESELADETEDPDEPQANFLGRVHSYSKLMHAHTKSQLASPTTGTLPSYTRTMHAFTLNQLNHQRTVTKSATNSPQLAATGSRNIILPRRICAELGKLSPDELPHNPSNTPEQGGQLARRSAEAQRLRKRSLTEPVPRDFAVASVARKDFAMAS